MSAVDSEEFGDAFPSIPGTNVSLISFQNIGRQPRHFNDDKALSTSTAFAKSQVDVALYAEHGLNESKLTPGDLFNARMRGKSLCSYSYISNNTNEDSDWRQYGGTGITMSPLFRSHHISHGSDPTKLGRWTHARFRGSANTTIRMIAAYRPCNSDDGIDTVWNQHVRYFQEHDNIANPNPVALFDRDLLDEMKRWLEMGDSIVLGIDVNGDVRPSFDDRRSVEFVSALVTMGLRDAVLSLHPSLPPPATQNRNQNRVPIDAIWVSRNVVVNRAGFSPFGGDLACVSDHRMLWVELDNSSILGKFLPCPRKQILASKVKSDDPRSRRLYYRRIRERYAQSSIGLRVTKLKTKIHRYVAGDLSLLPGIIEEFRSTKTDAIAISKDVADYLRTMYNDGCPWSPRIKKLRATIGY